VDEQRFDTWTRAFAQSGSRRRLLRALVGGTALLTAARRDLSDAAAHHGMAGPGEPCRTNDQCVAADAPMICDWNGYGSGTNCCTYEGSNCADDTWCCWSNLCIGGICTSQSYSCTGEGCACQPYRDPGCMASCPLYDQCDPGLECTGTADYPGTCVPSQPSGCTGEGCTCYQGTYDANPCDPGLVCCLNTDNSGTCLPQYTCTGYGLPGDDCPQYCLPGPTQCPGCISGYCAASGVCG
jgi:hypothetical protein